MLRGAELAGLVCLFALFTLPRASPAHECSASGSRDASELVCRHGPPSQDFINRSGTVGALTIQDWRDEVLDAAAILSDLPHLRRLSIVNGNLTRILGAFPPEARSLEEVEITGTGLRELTAGTFADLPALRTLDLRNNSVARIDPGDLIAISTLRDVYLSGNQMRCDESSAWFANLTFASLVRRIADREELRCSAPHKGRPLLPVMEVIQVPTYTQRRELVLGILMRRRLIFTLDPFAEQRLAEDCRALVICECELVYVVSNAASPEQQAAGHRQLVAFASVNCSRRAFTDMPAFLPADTTTLHLEGNEISDLTPLKSNPVYKRVLELYLDDNVIESAAILDGAYWLEQFRLLSLRGNKLTDFPTYALENVLPHNENAVSLYLGNNPWRCDCQFTPGFQELLIKYGNLVKDVSDVRCSSTGNGEFANKQIRELSRTEICVPAGEGYWLYPLDALNVLLGSLIFLILGKLLYDYWSFKRTGKLPWLVARIP